jgi:hypothetical protein
MRGDISFGFCANLVSVQQYGVAWRRRNLQQGCVIVSFRATRRPHVHESMSLAWLGTYFHGHVMVLVYCFYKEPVLVYFVFKRTH